jgi:hypothetical protein
MLDDFLMILFVLVSAIAVYQLTLKPLVASKKKVMRATIKAGTTVIKSVFKRNKIKETM